MAASGTTARHGQGPGAGRCARRGFWFRVVARLVEAGRRAWRRLGARDSVPDSGAEPCTVRTLGFSCTNEQALDVVKAANVGNRARAWMDSKVVRTKQRARKQRIGGELQHQVAPRRHVACFLPCTAKGWMQLDVRHWCSWDTSLVRSKTNDDRVRTNQKNNY